MFCGGFYEPDELPMKYHKGAVFTVELGSLVENGFDLGLSDYPIFDESYREPLNNKIIEHFYFREIGQETPGLFKRFLNRKMNEIMPYYNQLYKSAALEFDPFINFEMTTTGTTNGESSQQSQGTRSDEATTDASSSTDNTSTSSGRTLVSLTPQMQLAGNEDYATNITDTTGENGANATSSQDSHSTSSSTDSNTADVRTTEDYITQVKGLSGITASVALEQFRQTFLNIDMMVIEDLNELFFGLYTDYFNAL